MVRDGEDQRVRGQGRKTLKEVDVEAKVARGLGTKATTREM